MYKVYNINRKYIWILIYKKHVAYEVRFYDHSSMLDYINALSVGCSTEGAITYC
ncbi:hypothetical protein NMCA_09650 [Enterobacter ludwigii]|nr:hypothetical protein NMCA_09650 [Enterobacter ludwigii]